MRDIIHPAERLVQAMTRIYQYRMTTTSGGNLSIRDSDGSIWITPARVDKGAMRVEDIVRVLPDGTAEGKHRPSSEFPFHQKIYNARPDLGAIVHAHPVALVAFSICGQAPDTRATPAPSRTPKNPQLSVLQTASKVPRGPLSAPPHRESMIWSRPSFKRDSAMVNSTRLL